MPEPEGSSTYPLAREGLELVEAPDGMIVYDQVTDRVHHLNQTAAVILSLCDGTQTPEQIAVSVSKMFGTEHVPGDVTRECLEHLERERLIG